MTLTPTLKSIAALGVGDMVRTPLGRAARVCGFWGGHVKLNYCEDDGGQIAGDEVVLLATLLRFVRSAPPAKLPQGFFGDAVRRSRPKKFSTDYLDCE